MQFHTLQPAHKLKPKKRIGRGGKRGTYSGRGIKGQKSRAGKKLEPMIRGLIKRYPKMRGYKFKAREPQYKIVNIDVLEKKFKPGDIITPDVLLEKQIIFKIKTRTPNVKILGKGEITKPLTIKNCIISKNAKQKIEKLKKVSK